MKEDIEIRSLPLVSEARIIHKLSHTHTHTHTTQNGGVCYSAQRFMSQIMKTKEITGIIAKY